MQSYLFLYKPDLSDMDLHKTLDSLRGRDVVLFVADEGEMEN